MNNASRRSLVPRPSSEDTQSHTTPNNATPINAHRETARALGEAGWEHGGGCPKFRRSGCRLPAGCRGRAAEEGGARPALTCIKEVPPPAVGGEDGCGPTGLRFRVLAVCRLLCADSVVFSLRSEKHSHLTARFNLESFLVRAPTPAPASPLSGVSLDRLCEAKQAPSAAPIDRS